MSKNCDVCETNGRKRKAVWSHKSKGSEELCAECYRDILKFYCQFEKMEKETAK